MALSRRVAASLMALLLFLAMPITVTVAAEAQPVTLAQWMRAIFVTVDRQVDPTEKALALTPPPPPVPIVDPTSEPAPPRTPALQPEVPRFWLRRERGRKRRLLN